MISADFLIHLKGGEIKMFITESTVINANSANKLSLEDLIDLKNFYLRDYYKYSDIIVKLIIMKKLSEYMKSHPNTLLHQLSLGSLIRRIIDEYSITLILIKRDTVLNEEYKEFFSTRKDTRENMAIFCTNICIENIERYLYERAQSTT